MSDRKLAAFAALTLLGLSPGAQAQTVTLNCEIYWTSTQQIGGYEPSVFNWVDFSVFTLDMAGRQVINEYELAQGDKGTSVRAMTAVTPGKVMLCQADKCQVEVITSGTATEYTALTSIDLAANTMTRHIEMRTPNFINGLTYANTKRAAGTCVRV